MDWLELTKEQYIRTPTHDIFQIYVDPIVNEIHPAFKKIFGFVPIDESLLSYVFKYDKHRIIILLKPFQIRKKET